MPAAAARTQRPRRPVWLAFRRRRVCDAAHACMCRRYLPHRLLPPLPKQVAEGVGACGMVIVNNEHTVTRMPFKADEEVSAQPQIDWWAAGVFHCSSVVAAGVNVHSRLCLASDGRVGPLLHPVAELCVRICRCGGTRACCTLSPLTLVWRRRPPPTDPAQSEIKQIKMTSIMISSAAGELIEAQLGTFVHAATHKDHEGAGTACNCFGLLAVDWIAPDLWRRCCSTTVGGAAPLGRRWLMTDAMGTEPGVFRLEPGVRVRWRRRGGVPARAAPRAVVCVRAYTRPRACTLMGGECVTHPAWILRCCCCGAQVDDGAVPESAAERRRRQRREKAKRAANKVEL